MPGKNGTNGIHLDDPRYYIDRELSWLAFNDRVIEEAEDATTPLLERLKFLGIAASNLDEFFMVRVSGVQEQLAADVRTSNPAGFAPLEHFERIHQAAHRHVERMYRCLNERVLPKLEDEGIRIRRVRDLRGEQRKAVRSYFDNTLFATLTPLAVDSGHPFPHLRNLSLNLGVRLEPPRNYRANARSLFAVVQVPNMLERLHPLPARAGRVEFVLLEDLISEEMSSLFPGLKVREVCPFKVTRDADLEFAEEEADDLMKSIEKELRGRERGNAVRLTVDAKASPEIIRILSGHLNLKPLQVYPVDGPLNLWQIAAIGGFCDHRRDLKYAAFTPSVREPLRSSKNIFKTIARQDILLHHPFESFAPVVELVEQAARDPEVLAIKMTLYRTSGDSAIMKALMEAAEAGKQVAALMEIKARFDEERNIQWARRLERSGVHVVYGLVGLKTHAKLCLIVRREDGGIRRYVHLGTGNYNPITARIYTDLGLLTCDPDVADDASELFNLLTGYASTPEWRKMIIAPMALRESLEELIAGEVTKARAGKPGRIRAKMNSLIDAEIIRQLYQASGSGVKIDLQVRGVCGVRPGIPGVSDNIRVSSIVDRFLEHSRIFIFGEDEDERVFLASADWMERNLDRRIEVMFPIESPALKKRVIEEIWNTSIRDNVKRRILLQDGTYKRAERSKNDDRIRAQFHFLQVEQELRKGKEAPPESQKSGPVVLRSISVLEEDEVLPMVTGDSSTRARRMSTGKGPMTPIPPKAPAPRMESETAEAAISAAVPTTAADVSGRAD